MYTRSISAKTEVSTIRVFDLYQIETSEFVNGLVPRALFFSSREGVSFFQV